MRPEALAPLPGSICSVRHPQGPERVAQSTQLTAAQQNFDPLVRRCHPLRLNLSGRGWVTSANVV